MRRLLVAAAALALALILVALKLSIRSVATGESVLPGVAGAPVLGPAPTASPTPSPSRSRVRVQVTDPSGAPVSLALVELRDRFNAVQGASETGVNGDVILMVPAGAGYTGAARREGFTPATFGPFEVDRPPPTPAAGTPPRLPTQSIQVKMTAAARPGAPAVLSRLFVGHSQTPRLSLIDPVASLLLKHSDPLGQGRITLQAPSRDASKVYVSWMGSTDLWVLSGSELAVEKQVPLNGGALSALAVNPKDGHIWIATYNPDSTGDTGFLLEVDAASLDVVRRVTLGQMAAGLKFKPDGSLLYARHRTNSTLSFVDPGSGAIVKVARLAQFPTDMAISPDGARLYVVFLGSEKLVEIDAATGEIGRGVDVGTGGAGVLADPDGRSIYVVNQLLGAVQVVDFSAGQVTDLIPVGRSPQGAALVAGSLFVANSGSGTVSVVDLKTHTIRETLQTGGTPSSLTLVERL